jgi:hypothetical protein
MPPKKKGGGPSKKSVEKQKDKTLEDKTFGLKNKKKSKNVQKYIQEVTKQVKGGNTRADRMKEMEAKRKKDAKAEQENLKSLFAAAIKQPKVGRIHSNAAALAVQQTHVFGWMMAICRFLPEQTPSRFCAPSSRPACARRYAF